MGGAVLPPLAVWPVVTQSWSLWASIAVFSCWIGWLSNPMDCSTPGFPILHHLLEFAQTAVSNAIQPSHSLSPPFPPALSNRVFSNELTLRIRWPKYWSFSISPSNEYSRLISFRTNRFDLLADQGTLKSPLQRGLTRAASPRTGAVSAPVPMARPYLRAPCRRPSHTHR